MHVGTRWNWLTRRGEPGGRSWVRLGLVVGLLLLGGLAPAARGQSPRLNTYVSTDSVRIGERFTVSFVVRHAGGRTVSFPGFSGTVGGLDVLARRGAVTRSQGGHQVDSVTFEVTTFALDSARIPAVPVQLAAAGDTSLSRMPPRTVVVESVLGPASKGIHSVAPPAPFPRPLWAWLLAGLVAATLLAGLAYLWWRRQQPSAEPSSAVSAPTKIDQTPYEATTSWIRQLESYDLSDSDAVKPFYIELSSALRVYLDRELDVPALEQTTREVVEVLERRSDVPAEAVAQLRDVLELADLVKFADARPEANAHQAALADARAALDTIETTPRPSDVDGVASATE